MRRLDFSEFAAKYEYYKSVGARVKRDDGKYSHGIAYTLTDLLTVEERKKLDAYSNTVLFISQSQYAPEQVKTIVFIGNSPVKVKKAVAV